MMKINESVHKRVSAVLEAGLIGSAFVFAASIPAEYACDNGVETACEFPAVNADRAVNSMPVMEGQ